MKSNLQIGITGGIGAGKSLVCKIFSILGAPIYYADDRAKWLMSNSEPLKKKIIDHFGPESYANNELNRQYLAKHAFNDPNKLALLNSLVHPVVNDDYHDWLQKIDYPYSLKEAALLFETGSYKNLDVNVLVSAPLELRVNRVLKRDPFRSEEDIRAIVSKQMDEEEKKTLANYIIVNDGKSMLLPKVIQLHKIFLKSTLG